LNLNSEGNAIVSPIKIIKVTDRYNHPSNNINNLLSTKQLEPVQVHSVISNVGQQTKSDKLFSQSLDVKTLINTSSKLSSKKFDEIK
jgi:hypothetical protein